MFPNQNGKFNFRLLCVIMLSMVVCACSAQGDNPITPSASSTTVAATLTLAPTASALPLLSETPSPVPSNTALPVPTLSLTELAQVFPLAARGPYWTGVTEVIFTDTDRGGREVRVTLVYPALAEPDAEGLLVRQDAAPDMSGAPYPLVLTGGNSGDYLFKSHLASHGFVTAIVHYPQLPDKYDLFLVDLPLDVVFTLKQIALNAPAGLEGVIDANRTGVGGYSIDGLVSLEVSGARLDPSYYLDRCSHAAEIVPALSGFWLNYYCDLADNWDAFEAYAGTALTKGPDGLWQPISDPRILAVAPMAPDGAWLYGPRGLQAVDRPVMILTGSDDQLSFYDMETVFIFEHLGAGDKYLVSFIGENHMMVFDPVIISRLNHFATAFFGYYLDGRTEYGTFLTEEFVSGFDDLFWGVYIEP